MKRFYHNFVDLICKYILNGDSYEQQGQIVWQHILTTCTMEELTFRIGQGTM